MSTRKVLAAGITLLALAVAGCAGPADSTSADGKKIVKIGLSAAFSGRTAYFGQDSKKGAEIAIAQLAGSLPDVKIELVTADDECTPQGGASAFRRLTNVERVTVVLGSACSSATLGGMPILAQTKVPGMTFASTNAKISAQSGVGGNKYMWRMNIDDSIMGGTWAKYIAEQGVTSVGILAANNDFGRGAADLYKPLLAAGNVKLLATDFYDLGAADIRPQLTKMQAARPAGLITFAEPPDCGLIMRQMNEIGMKVPIYARGGCATEEALKATGDPKLAEGLVEASYWVATDDQKPFLDAFKAKYGDEHPTNNAALAYHGVLTIAEAIKAGGASSEGIQAGLAKVNFTSGIGPIRFDDHNQAHPDMFILKIEAGKIKILETKSTESAG